MLAKLNLGGRLTEVCLECWLLEGPTDELIGDPVSESSFKNSLEPSVCQ